MVDALNLIIIQQIQMEYNFFCNKYVLKLKVNQLKFLMNGSISLRV
jgi:hypothetical protein